MAVELILPAALARAYDLRHIDAAEIAQQCLDSFVG